MDRIKFQVGEMQDYPISKSLYEQAVGKDDRYFMKRADGERSCFAICPACNNPVQIIGLYKQNTHTELPFAKHYLGDLKIAKYFQENYDYCPYKAKRKQYNKSTLRNENNPLTYLIVKKLVQNFGKVVYIVSNWIGINISQNLAKEMLNDYFSGKGHLYVGSSLVNIPLMFAYFCISKTIYGRYLKITNEGNELKHVLQTKFGKFEGNQVKLSERVDFCFIHHSTDYSTETKKLTESLIFRLEEKKGLNIAPFFERKIEYSPEKAERLFHFQTNDPNTINRNSDFVRLAQEIAAKWGFTITV